LTIERAAKAVGFRPDKLKACEMGVQGLTFAQLRKIARAYRRPTAAFFLPEAPAPTKIPQFRRLPENAEQPLSPELRLAIRRIQQKREAAIELSEFAPESRWDIVGSVTLNENPEEVGNHVRRLLGVFDTLPKGAARDAFNYWRTRVEAAGVLVFQIPGVDVEEIRGCSIGEKPFPVIAVNQKDGYGPRSFTLLHEFSHMLVGDSSLCELHDDDYALGEGSTKSVETFCNHVAGAALVPARILMSTPTVGNHGPTMVWSESELQQLTSQFKVSKEVVLRRLLIMGLTTNRFYGEKRNEWKQEIRTSRKKGGGPPVHHQVLAAEGLPFTSMMIEAFHEKAIGLAELSELLSFDLKHLPNLERLLAQKVPRTR